MLAVDTVSSDWTESREREEGEKTSDSGDWGEKGAGGE